MPPALASRKCDKSKNVLSRTHEMESIHFLSCEDAKSAQKRSHVLKPVTLPRDPWRGTVGDLGREHGRAALAVLTRKVAV